MLPHFHWRTTVPHRAIHLRFVACSAESAIESAAAASLIKLQLRKRFPPATRKLHFSIPRNLFAIWMSRQMTGKIAMRMIWPNEIWFEGVKLSAAKGRFTTCFLVSLYTITHTHTHTRLLWSEAMENLYAVRNENAKFRFKNRTHRNLQSTANLLPPNWVGLSKREQFSDLSYQLLTRVTSKNMPHNCYTQLAFSTLGEWGKEKRFHSWKFFTQNYICRAPRLTNWQSKSRVNSNDQKAGIFRKLLGQIPPFAPPIPHGRSGRACGPKRGAVQKLVQRPTISMNPWC